MKIHTTQNLNSLVQLNQLSTNNVSSKDFRLKNYSEQMLMPKLSAEKSELYGSSVTFGSLFGKKKPNVKDMKKIINMRKKVVGDIKKAPQPETKKGDKFLLGSFFDKMLKMSNFGPITQSALAALVCTILRPATIMLMPDKNGKANNKYAAAHSISSGVAGFLLTTPLTYPFKQGGKYAQTKLIRDLKPEVISRLFPQIDIKSITDSAGNRLDMKFWKDLEGNKFSDNNKLVDMLPAFKQLADVSEITFEKILGVKDVDWAAHKGKSFNDVVLKDGKKLYDVIKADRLGITVSEEGFGTAQLLLKDLNYEYLQNLIKDANGTNWNKLDINSVYADAEHKVVKDFREWKDVNGKQWKLDLDEISVSSEYETADYKPRRTGEKRYDKKDKEYKFYSFQENGKDGKLGTKITEQMVEADLANEGQMKLIEWLPDLAFRIPIAATTIAMIPYVLKKVFHLEKHKKQDTQVKTVQAIVPEQVKPESVKPAVSAQPTFKGKSKEPSKFVKWLGKTFGVWVIKNPTIHKYSGKLSQLQGKLTAHMSTVGSLITSSVYVQQTLSKKDLDSDKRTTLAINQILCFIFPTALAYTADAKLDKFVKNGEYRYTGLQKQKRFLAEAKGKLYTEDEMKALSDKTKGIRVLASLLIFTTIYRYISPVLITPIANKIGDWYNDRRAAKKALKAKELAMNSETEIAKEIPINNAKEDTKQVA